MPPLGTMDEDLLLSSSPHDERRDPDDEVREIVNSLLGSTYLNPTVEKFLQDACSKELFFEVFARQANLIKSRCQSFDDGHVTVYDKVLLGLTENGNRFDSAASQEYFCEEFLGVSRDGDPIEAEKILQQNLALKAILAQAAHPEGKYGDKYSAETKYGDRGLHGPGTSTAVTKEDDMDANITRLSSIYEKAKSDFEAVPSSDTIAKLAAARFLRDTAENTIMYFRNPTRSDDGHDAATSNMEELISNLEATCKMAQASVVTLSGGRKRKFDRHDYEVLPRKAHGNGYHGRSSRRGHDSSGGGWSLGGRPPAKQWQDSSRDVRRSVELFPQRLDSSRDRRTFDYPRPVDSYHPANEAETGSHAHPYPQQHHHFPGSSSSAAHGYESERTQYQQQHAEPSLRYENARTHEQAYGQGHEYDSYRGGQGQQQQYGPEAQADLPTRGERGRGSYLHQQSTSRPSGSFSSSCSYRRRGGGGRGRGDGRAHTAATARGGGYQPEMRY